MAEFMRVLVEAAGYDTGWEYVIERESLRLVLGSARHGSRVLITPGSHTPSWLLEFSEGISPAELARSLPASILSQGRIEAWSLDILTAILRRAYELAVALPESPLESALADYESRIASELAADPSIRGTEREATVRQRVGQDLYRSRLLHYWNGCCAVTGCDIPELLRASHAKPWAACATDTERLDPFNGFLLRADYDALFDTGLISFTDTGALLCSPRLAFHQRRPLGLDQARSLRQISPRHCGYLEWHRRMWGFG